MNEIIICVAAVVIRVLELAANRRSMRRKYRAAKSPYNDYTLEQFEKDHGLQEEEGGSK